MILYILLSIGLYTALADYLSVRAWELLPRTLFVVLGEELIKNSFPWFKKGYSRYLCHITFGVVEYIKTAWPENYMGRLFPLWIHLMIWVINQFKPKVWFIVGCIVHIMWNIWLGLNNRLLITWAVALWWTFIMINIITLRQNLN